MKYLLKNLNYEIEMTYGKYVTFDDMSQFVIVKSSIQDESVFGDKPTRCFNKNLPLAGC